MVMAVNNAPLLTKSFDFSTLDDSYYKGQKLRQAYDTRQQEKLFNGIMKQQGMEKQIETAKRLPKHSGALQSMIHEYHSNQRKTKLANDKSEADLFKTQAETGKIGSETTGQEVKNAQGISDYISTAAVTRDPRAFQLKIGELTKRGLLTNAQTASLIKMVQGKPQTAAKVLEQMAMGNVEVAKIFKPDFEKVDAGDKVYGFGINGFTGESGQPSMQINKGQSPDNVLDNQTSRINASGNNQTSIQVADLNNQSRENINNANNEAKYTAEAQKAEIANNKGEVMQGADGMSYVFFPNTGRVEKLLDENEQHFQSIGKSNNTSSGGRKPKPAKILEMENEYISVLNETQNTGNQLQNWIDNLDMSSGNKQDKLELGLLDNTLNSAGNWLGVSSESGTKYAEFNAFVKDLASKALRLNAGVQTDSDYKRQLEAMVSGDYIPRNNATAITLLDKMKKDFEVARSSAYSGFSNIRSEYGGQMPQATAQQPMQNQQVQRPSMGNPEMDAGLANIFQ